ncbi:Upstream activation factor subunit spp27 [Melia azedarach]|uniref:Upstream activation factor subunit spp27 n=1 Tax=Melia azedarach TaxID=155640 RepID=A0ACC1XZI5_MELAZ|nr:Upstream activation factor subunit spp27 [Melia azedarach]
MLSDSDLAARLREILRTSDLDTTTPGSVRRQLEDEFKVDLSNRKTFVREQIDIFIRTLEKEQENVEDGNDVVGVKVEEEIEESESQQELSNNVEKKVKKRGGGFNKLCSLSTQLQKLVGVPELARTEVVKKIWAYIKENKLQDPNNKRKIICDESLQALFHVNSIDMFKMNKALSKHIWPLGAEDENVKQKIEDEDCHHSASRDLNDPEKEEAAEEEEEKEEKSIKQRSKRKGSTNVHEDVKKRRGGFTKLCSLSPELQTLVGVPELARTEVVKKLWSYIREKNLQDPKNKRNIICDESLQALFRVNSINMFQMNKALTRHIWPLDEENVNS